MQRLVLSLIAMMILATPTHAVAASSVTDSALDAVIFRPLGAVSTLVGGVLFVPAALLASPNGKDGIDEAWTTFVTGPWDTTFKRPLGEF